MGKGGNARAIAKSSSACVATFLEGEALFARRKSALVATYRAKALIERSNSREGCGCHINNPVVIAATIRRLLATKIFLVRTAVSYRGGNSFTGTMIINGDLAPTRDALTWFAASNKIAVGADIRPRTIVMTAIAGPASSMTRAATRSPGAATTEPASKTIIV